MHHRRKQSAANVYSALMYRGLEVSKAIGGRILLAPKSPLHCVSDFGNPSSTQTATWAIQKKESKIALSIRVIARSHDLLCFLGRVRTMEGHRGRVGTMAWSSHLLSSGSRDRAILQRDIRVPEDYTSRLTGHRSEVLILHITYMSHMLCFKGLFHVSIGHGNQHCCYTDFVVKRRFPRGLLTA